MIQRKRTRLARIKHNKGVFQERIVSCREEEYARFRGEREDQISQILHSRRQVREKMRKLKFYLSLEEERQRKLHEEAQKHKEAERRRKEEAEGKAKLDKIAEKQRQREQELEEKERQRREALLRRSTEGPLKPSEPPTVAQPTELVSAAPAVAVAAPGPASGKYVPRFRQERAESSGQAPPPESDQWGGGRQDDRISQADAKWRRDDRRSSGGSSFGGGGSSRSTSLN